MFSWLWGRQSDSESSDDIDVVEEKSSTESESERCKKKPAAKRAKELRGKKQLDSTESDSSTDSEELEREYRKKIF